MSTFLVKARSVDAGQARAVAVPAPPIDAAVVEADEDGRLRPARGIIHGILLAAPVWMLIALVIYLLA